MKLTQTPSNLEKGKFGAQDRENAETIEQLKKEGIVENLGESRWILRFKEHPEIIFDIDSFGSRGAYLAFSGAEKSVLDEGFNLTELDYQKMAKTVPLQNVSQIATFLLFLQSKDTDEFKHLHASPTWPVPIPGRPKELSDENYLVAKRFIPNLTRLKKMDWSGACHELRSIPHEALKEMHTMIIKTGAWNHLNSNLNTAPDAPDDIKQYYFVNIQGPFNHHLKYFCFQGEEGKEKHAEDVAKSLDRMVYGRSTDQPPSKYPGLDDVDRTEEWKKLTQETEVLKILQKSKYKPKFMD